MAWGAEVMELDIINKLFLELSQVATATTKRELELEARILRLRDCLEYVVSYGEHGTFDAAKETLQEDDNWKGDGHDCGCCGLPIEPCTCSIICEDALYKHIGATMDMRRKIAGIDKWVPK